MQKTLGDQAQSRRRRRHTTQSRLGHHITRDMVLKRNRRLAPLTKAPVFPAGFRGAPCLTTPGLFVWTTPDGVMVLRTERRATCRCRGRAATYQDIINSDVPIGAWSGALHLRVPIRIRYQRCSQDILVVPLPSLLRIPSLPGCNIVTCPLLPCVAFVSSFFGAAPGLGWCGPFLSCCRAAGFRVSTVSVFFSLFVRLLPCWHDSGSFLGFAVLFIRRSL